MTSACRETILIAGPTASGKSARAIEFARACGGVVINADSMQVYRELAILTARPTASELEAAPHRLYGHVPAAAAYSVAHWLRDVAAALEEARREGWTPIVVGGTGLYFKALLEGLSPVPEIPDAVRSHWRQVAGSARPGELHALLRERDPEMAGRLEPGDRQRLTRALEVVAATGRSLADWQRERAVPLVVPDETRRILVLPPRKALLGRCDQRFDQMMEMGALAEVRALAGLGLPRSSPAMRALGVAPLLSHIEAGVPIEAAAQRAKIETHQYVKRQETWARRYMADWERQAPPWCMA